MSYYGCIEVCGVQSMIIQAMHHLTSQETGMYSIARLITNYLITKSEVITGKYQTEALLSDCKFNTVGQVLRFSCNNQTVKVINGEAEN